jgi:flagellar hook capping protein FlgD
MNEQQRRVQRAPSSHERSSDRLKQPRQGDQGEWRIGPRICKSLQRSLALAGAVIATLILAPVALADPSPFATSTAGCGTGFADVSFPAQSANHSDAIYSLTSNGASGWVEGADGNNFNAGDEVWGDLGEVAANTPTQMYVYCSGGSITVQLYDRQDTPATFTGTASADGTDSDSYLPFIATGTGQYVADVTLNQGAINLNGSTVVDSSQEVPLGSLSAGDNELEVFAVSGPAAVYSITIRELPVAISGLTFGDGYDPAPTYAAPGTILTGSFSVSGDTTITAYVCNSGGAIVRHLGSFAAGEGDSSVTWDARGDDGATLPDGTYYLELDSTDPNGNVTSAQTSIILDGTPPVVAMTSPDQIGPSQAVSFAVSDAESGVAGISLTVDGQDVVDYGNSADGWYGYGSAVPADGQFSYSGPWSLGTHTWEIVATDNVGNTTDESGSFVVANPSRPLAPSSPSTQANPEHRCGSRTSVGPIYNLGNLTTYNMTCQAGVKAVRQSHWKGKLGNIRTSGFRCKAVHSYRSQGTVLGANVRCTSGSKWFEFSWAT